MRKSNFDFKTRAHKVLPPHKRPPPSPPPPPPKSSIASFAFSAPRGLFSLVDDVDPEVLELRKWPQPEVKKQISAPFYLRSLAENELPPFKHPGKEPRPTILVGMNTLVTEADIVEIVAAYVEDPQHGIQKSLKSLILRLKLTNNYDLIERSFLILLLKEAFRYAAQRDFTSLKASVLFTIYLTTHKYFKWFYWTPPVAVWQFFKELLIRHTIEDAPDSVEIFEPDECYDILSHFHTLYFTNLPLVHILTFRVHRLKLCWPFTPKR